MRKRANPKKFGITPIKASVVYGPSCTGKKKIISDALKIFGYNVFVISEKKQLKKKFMAEYGVLGKNAYIVDVDNFQTFPTVSHLTGKKSPPVIFVCVNPFDKAKRRWKEISKNLLVVDSKRDSFFKNFFQPHENSLKKESSRYFQGVIGKKDIQNEITPWDVVRYISSSVPLQKKIEVTSFHKKKLDNTFWKNCYALGGRGDSLLRVRNLSKYLDNLCYMDTMDTQTKTKQLVESRDYTLCGTLLSSKYLGITPHHKLIYKNSRYNNGRTSKIHPLFEGDRFDSLRQGNKRKRRVQKHNSKGKMYKYPLLKF